MHRAFILSQKKILFFLIFFSQCVSIYPEVFINQLGFLPSTEKYFITNTESDSFYVVDSQLHQIIYRGALELHTISDASTGMTLFKGDFTSLNIEGQYYIELKSGEKSYNFLISNGTYNDAFYKVLRGFYYWRCGMNLSVTFAGDYSHNKCHSADGFFHSTTGFTGFSLKTGGWHDAGDYGKYIVNGAISVGTMLMAYELFPDRFNQDNFNIPESGNDIPDILDENRYEIEWFLKMQNSDGGVFHKLTKNNFESTVMPNLDSGQRLVYQISSTATGDFAAVCAMAARLYKNYDQSFADTCLNAALKAWQFLEAHNSIVPSGGFKNPSDTFTGEYGDGNDTDERLWAASELFLSTGEDKYHSYFKTNYNKYGVLNSSMSWGSVRSMGQLSYLMSNNSAAEAEIQNTLLDGLNTYCNQLVSISSSDGMGVTLQSTGYNWGSNSDVLNKAIMLILGYEKTGEQKYYNTALKQLNYIYGINGNNISFVTGTGTKPVMNPHHRPSQADINVNPVPGYVAGGPNNHGTGGDNLLNNLISKGTPAALCYLDNSGSWASNEVCLNWNSPLVFVTGYFNAEGGVVSVNDREKTELPLKINLEQNFPNPFNGTTRIKFSLQEKQNIIFKVFDIIGNKIADVDLGMLNEGENQFNWYAIYKGEELPSGIYFYMLEGNEMSAVKKLLLVK